MIDDIRIDKMWKMTDNTVNPDDLDIDELMLMAFEEKAAELEITVDYYMAEFI